MANSANPEINKKIATSALGTLFIATVFFYLGDRYAETLVTYPGQIFDHLSDAFLSMWETIGDAPFTLDMTSNSLLFGGACFLIIWMIWLRYVAFIGNYRSGEESGSARWGTLKEGKKFKDLQTEDNNLLFTKNFGLALHRPKFDPEYDRNLNVLVVGGSGSGKTFNYVTPNICQLNTSYFVTDPKGTLLKDAGYLFTDNGYKLKSFNTINLDESMHYNPLKYVKTDTDILSFVNCFIMNTNPEGKSSGDPFWENAEKMLYTALIALLRDWFPAKDYNMSSLLTLLSLAEARENDENFKSALDLMFLQIEEGKKYKQNDGSSPDAAGNAGLSRSFGTKQADNGWSWVPSKFKRNSDGVKPADCGGLSADEDFALMNYKNFKVAAGKTLKSILISCNVRLAPIATDGVRELLTYDEMEIDTLGDPDAKVAIFGILSDTDKTLSFLFAILMWQTIDQLCRKALSDYGGKLPTPVHFIFDEFANIGTIPQIEETIAVTRSRNIGITIILQSMSQLESKYDKKAQTIIISTARQNSIELDTYDYRQRQGLNSILPLGHNHVEISRMFTTAQISILVPFATQELDDAGGNFYGQNKHSRNLVVCNRKKLTSPMGFVCGKTGSGKGMFTKTEMTGTIFSNPTDEIYVIDRAGEYTAIAERYGGSTYHFGVGTGTHLNPFDTVSVEHMTRNEQIAFKVDAMLAQAGASAAEAGSNFSEVDQSLVQRCTELAFQKAAERGDNLPPTLQDFYDAANEQPEEQAQVIALRYERFVKGSMNFFNHQSNVDFNTRIVDFNLKDLPDSMLVFALINVCEAVRNRMYFNAKRNVRTWLYVEEMQSMFAYPTVLNYFSRFSNEGRKFGLLLTGISQNATAMLANEAARNIVLNADFLMLLKQSPLDRMKWAELLNLSEQEEECIDESAEPGDGLLIAGNARVPIRGKFPSGNVLYDLFSTNPNETKKTGLGDKKDAKPVI